MQAIDAREDQVCHLDSCSSGSELSPFKLHGQPRHCFNAKKPRAQNLVFFIIPNRCFLFSRTLPNSRSTFTGRLPFKGKSLRAFLTSSLQERAIDGNPKIPQKHSHRRVGDEFSTSCENLVLSVAILQHFLWSSNKPNSHHVLACVTAYNVYYVK